VIDTLSIDSLKAIERMRGHLRPIQIHIVSRRLALMEVDKVTVLQANDGIDRWFMSRLYWQQISRGFVDSEIRADNRMTMLEGIPVYDHTNYHDWLDDMLYRAHKRLDEAMA